MHYGDQLFQRSSSLCLAAVLSIGLARTSAMAAPFQDLDFEQATVQPDPNSPVGDEGPLSAAAAFPGWIATEDGMALGDVLGLALPLDGTFVALVFPYVVGSNTTDSAPQGQYAAYLSGDADPLSDSPKSASLSQTGDVPADAASIEFLTGNLYPTFGAGQKPLFSINGTNVPVSPVGASGTSELWAGDVTPYAGTTATITFTAAGVSGYSLSNEDFYILDAVSFSTQSVPEPFNAVGVGLIGTTLLSTRQRRARAADHHPSTAH